MNVSTIVAGYGATWRFRNSRKLDEWLAGQPWRDNGGVVAIRVASALQAEPTITALARAARAADEFGDLRVLVIPHQDLILSLRTAVVRALELDESLGGPEAIRRVGEELLRPHLIVAEPPDGPASIGLFDAAARLRDDIARVSPASAFTIALLELPTHPLPGDPMDFSVGGPADGLLDLLDGSESELWRAYVHARLAWEAAGDLSLAWEAAGPEFAGLAIGDDTGLERLLNRFAGDALIRLGPLGADCTARLIRCAGQRQGRSATQPSSGELESCGIYWRPSGEPLPRPAPWWARVILLQGNAGSLRYLLRSCLVCAPMAREILLRCFDLEALDRADCSPRLRPDADADADLAGRLQNFRDGHPDSEARHYPDGCPAAPTLPTDFASYGAILASLPRDPDPAQHDARHRLRRLRNTVAHGHYVSWATLREVRDIGGILAWK